MKSHATRMFYGVDIYNQNDVEEWIHETDQLKTENHHIQRIIDQKTAAIQPIEVSRADLS